MHGRAVGVAALPAWLRPLAFLGAAVFEQQGGFAPHPLLQPARAKFVLKGLGSAGQDTERTLRRAILGYYRDDLYLVPPSNIAQRPDDTSYDPDPIP